MPIFKYKALDSQGKKNEGLIEADTKDRAAIILNDKGYSIVSLEKKGGIDIDFGKFFNWIKIKDVVIFSRQFSVLISANVPLVQSLKILVEQTENPNFKKIIAEMADEIDSGAKLSDSFSKYPKIFTPFYVNVIKSGETSGKLDEVLNYLADEMEKDYDMASKVKGAMIYPAFILTGLVVVGFLMMIFVIPKLTAVLAETGAELPLSTRVLMGTSEFLKGYWWLLIGGAVGAFFGIRYYVKTPNGKRIFDKIKLKLPIFGKLLQRIYLVRFTRSMNTLIVGGVSITHSLEVAGEVAENEVYRDLIHQTSRAVEDGNSISSVFIKSDDIPKMVSQMMSVGERTGKLDLVLEKITDFYTREIDNIVANLMSLMEPIIMVVIGIAVGMMVAAIILPMYNMASGF